jgi:hypothetical protein
MGYQASPYKKRLLKNGSTPVKKVSEEEQQIYSTFKPPNSALEGKIEEKSSSQENLFGMENNTPSRMESTTTAAVVGQNEIHKGGIEDEIKKRSVISDDHKWKSNSLTKTRTAQMTQNGSITNLYKNNSQRLCNSESSSPQTERRNDPITSSPRSNEESTMTFEANPLINVNSRLNSNAPLKNKDFNPHMLENTEKVIIPKEPNRSNQKVNGNNSSSDCNVSEFAQVSEDMNELVYHLNSIQNDISELAGKSISISENNA